MGMPIEKLDKFGVSDNISIKRNENFVNKIKYLSF